MVALSFILPAGSGGLGTIERQMGVGIYVKSRPVRDYDTITVYEVKRDFNAYPGPSSEQKVIGIKPPLDLLVRKAIKRAKRKKDVDAIITDDCKKAVAIRYKEKEDKSLYNRSSVMEYKNYRLYILNKPLAKYTTVQSISITKKLNLDFSGYDGLNQMLDSMILRFQKKYPDAKADGIITSNGLDAEFILLNQ